MAPDKLPPLEDTALFRGLTPEAVVETLAAATSRALDAGQTLFLQGEPVDALYVVETGRLKLSQVTPNGDEVTVRTVGRGAIVAGVAILDRRTLPVTGTALVPSRVLVWPRSRILPLVVKHPGLRINVLETIADRMQASLTRIRELSTDSVGQRVARALLGLARESGRAVAEGILIDQPLGRQELADLAGTSMFTASRLLAGWARDGVLDVGRQRVVVRSLEKLETLAGGPEQP
jgi:CRP-like cAMP-binding protein